jgi:NIMA (never in mitosis gene a)-related kinase
MDENEIFISKIQDFQILKDNSSNNSNINYSSYKVKRIIDNQIYRMYQFKLSDYWGKFISTKKKYIIINKLNKIASLKSKYIVLYRDSFIDKVSNSFILITDYYTNTLYNNIIMKHSDIHINIPEENIIKYIYQIAHGLFELHTINIYNINLNSINIFIDDENNIRLNPFNDIIYHDEIINNNDNPIVCPELINEKPNFSEKSDIWYFGLLIYEMCCLKKMKRKFVEDLNQMYSYIIKSEYEPIPNIYSKEIANIIKGCLQFSENRRLTSEEIENKILKLKAKKIVNKKVEEFKYNKKWEKNHFLKIKTREDYNKILLQNQKFQRNKTPINKTNSFVENRFKNPLNIRNRKKPLTTLNYERLNWNGKLYFSRNKTPNINLFYINNSINKYNEHNRSYNINENKDNLNNIDFDNRTVKRIKSQNNIDVHNLSDINNLKERKVDLNYRSFKKLKNKNSIQNINDRNINLTNQYYNFLNRKLVIKYRIRYHEEINFPNKKRIEIPPLRLNEINQKLKRNNSVNL